MDIINKPEHYTERKHEHINVSEHLSFNLGNAVKYVWRYKQKNGVEDLKKAEWYLAREYVHINANQGISKSTVDELLDIVKECDFEYHEANVLYNCIKACNKCNNKHIYLENAVKNLRVLIENNS